MRVDDPILMHYGVKGMHWGKQLLRDAGFKDIDPNKQYQELLQTRLLEQQLKQLKESNKPTQEVAKSNLEQMPSLNGSIKLKNPVSKQEDVTETNPYSGKTLNEIVEMVKPPTGRMFPAVQDEYGLSGESSHIYNRLLQLVEKNQITESIADAYYKRVNQEKIKPSAVKKGLYVSDNTLLKHWGIKFRSGRYPWGSGNRPYQGDNPSDIPANARPKGQGKRTDTQFEAKQLLSDQERLKTASLQDLNNLIQRLDLEKRIAVNVAEADAANRGVVKKVIDKVGPMILNKTAEFAVNQLMSTLSKRFFGADHTKALVEMKKMSLDELKSTVSRLQMEKQFQELTGISKKSK